MPARQKKYVNTNKFNISPITNRRQQPKFYTHNPTYQKLRNSYIQNFKLQQKRAARNRENQLSWQKISQKWGEFWNSASTSKFWLKFSFKKSKISCSQPKSSGFSNKYWQLAPLSNHRNFDLIYSTESNFSKSSPTSSKANYAKSIYYMSNDNLNYESMPLQTVQAPLELNFSTTHNKSLWSYASNFSSWSNFENYRQTCKFEKQLKRSIKHQAFCTHCIHCKCQKLKLKARSKSLKHQYHYRMTLLNHNLIKYLREK